ncbi:GGDEF domain-containing protein [Clostridium culturomicium]|uniref:GGDEF domain-containing protein n=1 Tax=Clostridium culturomicium TaxID=1499683 RepID=UPI00058FC2A8|nr:GGDEF domain-containing protein [Clostridium culturomicium]
MDALREVKERLSIFKNLYDSIRLVNPINDSIINHECENLSVKSGFCYDIWKRNERCENCISRVAYDKEETAVKIEYSEGKIILVIASPLIIKNNKYVIEMIKDVSQNGRISNMDTNYEESVLGFLNVIKERTVKDELTDVYNKAYINERLPKDLRISVNENLSTSVVMIDLDYFKNINDTYGHVIGDKVLRDFAAIVKNYTRSDSMYWIGRYGGEEFILVLNNADEDIAQNIAERIRKRINDNIFKYDDVEIRITCSLGIYSSNGKDINMDDAVEKADKNLYKAKASGRNKIVN